MDIDSGSLHSIWHFQSFHDNPETANGADFLALALEQVAPVFAHVVAPGYGPRVLAARTADAERRDMPDRHAAARLSAEAYTLALARWIESETALRAAPGEPR